MWRYYTHIAITGEQIDIFPYLNAHGYFDPDYDSKDDSLKSFFLLQIPVRLYRRNIENLFEGNSEKVFFEYIDSQYVDCNVSVQGSRRKDQSDQVQFSLVRYDSEDFKKFRRLLKVGDCIVLLKYKGEFKYDLFGLKNGSEEAEALRDLNNRFYKEKNSVSKVLSQLFVRINENQTVISENLSEDELVEILKKMYKSAEEDLGDFQVCSLISFGIKFANVLKKNNIKVSNLVDKAGLNPTYKGEMQKGIKLRDSFEKNLFDITLC